MTRNKLAQFGEQIANEAAAWFGEEPLYYTDWEPRHAPGQRVSRNPAVYEARVANANRRPSGAVRGQYVGKATSYDGRHQSGQHHALNRMEYDARKKQTVYVRRAETLSPEGAARLEANAMRHRGIGERGTYTQNRRVEQGPSIFDALGRAIDRFTR